MQKKCLPYSILHAAFIACRNFLNFTIHWAFFLRSYTHTPPRRHTASMHKKKKSERRGERPHCYIALPQVMWPWVRLRNIVLHTNWYIKCWVLPDNELGCRDMAAQRHTGGRNHTWCKKPRKRNDLTLWPYTVHSLASCGWVFLCKFYGSYIQLVFVKTCARTLPLFFPPFCRTRRFDHFSELPKGGATHFNHRSRSRHFLMLRVLDPSKSWTTCKKVTVMTLKMALLV